MRSLLTRLLDCYVFSYFINQVQTDVLNWILRFITLKFRQRVIVAFFYFPNFYYMKIDHARLTLCKFEPSELFPLPSKNPHSWRSGTPFAVKMWTSHISYSYSLVKQHHSKVMFAFTDNTILADDFSYMLVRYCCMATENRLKAALALL